MSIGEKITDEKLQYNINRQAAKISSLSSGKIHKCKYLTGKDILPSSNQQIIEQTKFTYSPLGKAFEKQIKAIKDQGKKQVDALEKSKPEEQKKTIEDKSNNSSKARIIFDDLTIKRKELMSQLYDSVDYDNLNFGYVGSTKDVSFYEYRDFKDLLKKIKKKQPD